MTHKQRNFIQRIIDEDNLSAGTTYYYRIRGYNDYNAVDTTSYTAQQSTEIIEGYLFNFDNENPCPLAPI